MKTALMLSALGLTLLAGDVALETRYATDRELAIESETILALETVEFRMERDGEPVDARGGGGGASTRAVHRVSQVDRILEVDDEGAPERVRRRFVDVGGERRLRMADNDIEGDIESPFDRLVLELTAKGSGAEARVVEGRRPEGTDALEGHKLGLALDALLPGRKVEVGDEWDLESAAIQRALGIDVLRKLFPRPAPEERGEGEGRGRGGRGGGRGFGGGGGSGPGDLLARGTWSGTAKLVELDHDHDGVVCALIELELEARGELPERTGFGGGRGERGGRSLESAAAAGLRAGSFEIELTGSLLFAIESRVPVKLELEGEMRTERDQEMGGRGGGSMRIHQVEQGTLRHVVTVTPQAVAED